MFLIRLIREHIPKNIYKNINIYKLTHSEEKWTNEDGTSVSNTRHKKRQHARSEDNFFCDWALVIENNNFRL